MAIEVSTTEFEFSHGKKPRGTGCWAFFIGRDPEPFFHCGSFADARRMAIAMAISKGETFIKVGP